MSINVTTLPNGLRVVSESMPQLETVAIGAWFDVGTRNEDAAQNGIAHLLEHMLFKGTKRRSALAIAEEIESVGGHTNAYTSREHTAYYARVLHGDIELAVDLLADIVQNSVFDPIELEREKQVIIQEIGQSFDTPDDIVFDYLQKSAYGDQPLGRPILGIPELITAVSSEDIIRYQRRYYGANRMILAAAGKVNHAELVRLAERHFGGLPRTDNAVIAPSLYNPVPSLESRNVEQGHVVLAFPACGNRDDNYFAYSVYSTLMGGSSSSRLFQEVREKLGLAYSIYSFISNTDDSGIWGVYAAPGPQSVRQLSDVLRAQFANSLDHITDDELKRAKQQLKASTLMSLEQPFGRAEQAAQSLLTFDRILPLSEIIEKIEAVDKKDMQDLMRQSLSHKPALAAVGPEMAVEEWRKFELN